MEKEAAGLDFLGMVGFGLREGYKGIRGVRYIQTKS